MADAPARPPDVPARDIPARDIPARVLVTRPEPDAAAFAAALAKIGVEAVVAPLLEIEFVSGVAPDLGGVQALLFTSANGVRAFAASTATADAENADARALPVFAVGDATARAAIEAGFGRVETAGGDVDDLARLVASRILPGDGALLHVAGSAVAGDLGGALTDAGFTVRRAVLYTARKVRELPAGAVDAIADGGLHGVALFSPRTGAAFRELVTRAGLAGKCTTMTAYCLSAAVADAVAGMESGLAWREIAVAARPDIAALLDAIRTSIESEAGG